MALTNQRFALELLPTKSFLAKIFLLPIDLLI